MAGPDSPSVGFVRTKDLENNVELYRYGQEAMAMVAENVPKNTQKSYMPKIKEWEVRTIFPRKSNDNAANKASRISAQKRILPTVVR